MMMITREVDFCNAATRQEGDKSSDAKVNLHGKTVTVAGFSASRPTTSSSTSTTSWTRLKDPRIVRVSRAFGGKDRHSKVCTVRGLRDRRVRLSVPTAIQLYDLQDRLGLNQPSKVVDWLLDAAKGDIDQLPPLQIPPRIFDPFLTAPPSTAVSAVSTPPPPFTSFLRWDPSPPPPTKPELDHFHTFNNAVLSSPSLPSAAVSSQVLVCPPPGLQPYSFLHHPAASPPELDLKQIINFQMLMSSTSQPPFSTSLQPPPPPPLVIKPMHFLHSHHAGAPPDKNEEP